MPEELPGKQQVNVRIDPALHWVMRNGSNLLGITTAEMYERAGWEYLTNHPEIISGIEELLVEEREVISNAIGRIAEIKQSQNPESQ